MSRLEAAVQLDLTALARGGRRLDDLDNRALGIVARWAAKTAYAAQSVAIGPRLIPVEHRRLLCDGGLGDLRIVGRVSSVGLDG